MAENRKTKLNDVVLEHVTRNKSTRINIICDSKIFCLSDERTSGMNYLSYSVTDRYIVAYLTNLHEQCKVRVTGLYDRAEKQIIQVTKQNREYIKNTLVSQTAFYLSTVLEYLNHGKAEAAAEEECAEFEAFLTSGRNFSREEIEKWIYKDYPALEEFANRDKPLKLAVYFEALKAVGKEDLYFYAMPITF